MSKVSITESLLTDIANAIRAKTGGQASMTPAEMAQEIADIPQGANEPYVEHTLQYSTAGDASIIAAELHGYDTVPVQMFGSTDIALIEIPDAVTAISGSAFSSCTKLEAVVFPSSLNRIGNGAFRWCSKMTEIWIPSVTEIEANAFMQCSNMATAKIGSASTIATSAFGSCSKLRNIYVGWAENAVAGAPWGATNATIHYGCTFDSNGNVISG